MKWPFAKKKRPWTGGWHGRLIRLMVGMQLLETRQIWRQFGGVVRCWTIPLSRPLPTDQYRHHGRSRN